MRWYVSEATGAAMRRFSMQVIGDEVEAQFNDGVQDVDEVAALVMGLAEVESRCNPFAVRYEPGLRGATWVTAALRHAAYPEDWRYYASWGPLQILGVNMYAAHTGVEPSEFCIVEKNVYYAVRHLKRLLDRYSPSEAVSAYNAGRPTARNRRYVEKVFAAAKEYRKEV